MSSIVFVRHNAGQWLSGLGLRNLMSAGPQTRTTK